MTDGSCLSFFGGPATSTPLFANMLDHAIESAVKVPEPERRCIDLLVCTRQSFVVVNVISPDRPAESADTRAAHYAVKVTNRIVQKYKGTLTTESQNGFFAVKNYFFRRGDNLSVTATAVPLPGLRHPASAALCLRLAGRGPNSDSLFPPLAAVVVVAPIEERPWHFVKPALLRQRLPSVGELSAKQTERLRPSHKINVRWSLFFFDLFVVSNCL